ncbi:hypothetical protein [Modestobacter versicolor]|uniref:hypothetical protein n=1 Tax=Modestobacter versicolor TaxID=429133 RepID=UPI0034DEE533
MTRFRRPADQPAGPAAETAPPADRTQEVLEAISRLEHLQVEQLIGVHPRRHRGLDKAAQLQLALTYRELIAAGRPLPSFADAELRFYSQNGEDGIVQLLLAAVGAETRKTVELCAGDGIECNSANLIVTHGWTGLLVDGGEELVTKGRRFYEDGADTWYWPPTLLRSWVTRDNVNQLVTDAGFAGDIDVLTIDLDGVDYWIWEALDCVRSRVVIVEYNAGWGPEEAMTVPYSDSFAWEMGSQYFGASLGAMVKLAASKGYRFVGTNSYAFNAFFVREDLGLPALPTADPADVFWHPGAARSISRLDAVRDREWVRV